MGSVSRKMKRKILAEQRKQAEKDMTQKMNMFDRISDHCDACDKPFDKKDKDMVSSWNVVVRSKEEVVRLYCPACWAKAKNIIKEFNQ